MGECFASRLGLRSKAGRNLTGLILTFLHMRCDDFGRVMQHAFHLHHLPSQDARHIVSEDSEQDFKLRIADDLRLLLVGLSC